MFSAGSSAVGYTYRNWQQWGNGPCITGRVGRFRFCRPQYPPPKTQNLLWSRRSSAGMAGVVRSKSISIRPYWQPPIRVACHQHRSTAGIRPRTIVICTFHSGCSSNRWRSWCRSPTIRRRYAGIQTLQGEWSNGGGSKASEHSLRN